MEDGCSSVTKQKIDGYLPSSSGISPNSTIIVDRNRLGWMTTVWELNIPEDNDEMQQVKKLQQKSETHRINANRTYWLYFWSGGYDIYLLQKIHEVKLENYVQKQKIFQEKCKKDEQKMERNGEENGGKNEKNQQNMEKCVNNYCSMDEVEEEEKNQNAMKNETDYPSKVHNTQQQWMEEKTAMEEEMKEAMEELKCLEQRIELQRDCFNGRIKFLRTIWDEEFFSPFETIDTSAQKLTHRNEDTYIIRLSSTAVGNITLTKRSMVEGKEKVTHRRLPIVGSSIFDYEYLTVIRNNQANNYVVDDMKVRGYYPAHLLSYVYVQK